MKKDTINEYINSKTDPKRREILLEAINRDVEKNYYNEYNEPPLKKSKVIDNSNITLIDASFDDIHIIDTSHYRYPSVCCATINPDMIKDYKKNTNHNLEKVNSRLDKELDYILEKFDIPGMGDIPDRRDLNKTKYIHKGCDNKYIVWKVLEINADAINKVLLRLNAWIKGYRVILDKLQNNKNQINEFNTARITYWKIPHDKIIKIIEINDGIPKFNTPDTIGNEGLYLLIECLKNINRNVIILDEIYKGNMLMVTEMKKNDIEDYSKSRKYFIPLERTRLIFNSKVTLKEKNTLEEIDTLKEIYTLNENDKSFCNNVVYLNKENMTYINPYNEHAFNLWTSKNINDANIKWDIMSKNFKDMIDLIDNSNLKILLTTY